MAEVASAFVSIMPSAKGFGSKLDSQIGGDVKKSGSKLGKGFGKIFAVAGGAAVGAGMVSFFKTGATDARAYEKAFDATRQIIEATGGAANVTAEQVGKMSGRLEAMSGVDDEVIQKSANLLLTFKNIRNEVGKGSDIFDRANVAALDLSAAGFGSVESQAKSLGKALNDPLKGISALSRSGVTFTAQQQEQIKALVATGDTLKAQKIILGEVEAQVGGVAASQVSAADRAAVAWDNFRQQIGVALLPVIDNVATVFADKVIPAMAGFVTGMQTGTGAGGRFAAAASSTVRTLGALAGFVNRNRTAFVALAAAIGSAMVVTKVYVVVMAVRAAGGLLAMFKATKTITAAQWLFNAALTANPIGLVIVAIAALAAGLVIAYKKSETFRNVVDGAFSAVRSGARSLADFVTRAIPAAFGKVVEFVRGIPAKIAAIFTGAASIFYNAGSQLMAQLAAGIADKIGDAIAAAQAGLDRLKGLLPGSPIKWGPLKNWNKGGAGKRLMELVAKGITAATPKTVKAAQSAFEKIGDALKSQRDKIRGTLDTLKGDFASLADSVSSAFTGDLFGISAVEADAEAGIAARSVGQVFVDNLMSKKGELTALLSSFKTLKGWGLDPAFLSQLFASGNGALITELAGMGQTGAVGAATLFGEVNSLGDQLGSAVASNDPVARAIEDNGKELREVNRQLSFLADDIGKQLNGAAAKARRNKKNGGKK